MKVFIEFILYDFIFLLNECVDVYELYKVMLDFVCAIRKRQEI